MIKLRITVIASLLCLFFSFSLEAQEKENRDLGSFHGISVGSIVTAELIKGNKNNILIKVDGYELSDVETKIDNGILKVGMKNNRIKTWNNRNRVLVTITYAQEPDMISVSSSADIIGKSIVKGDDLKLSVSSSGDMSIEVEVIRLKASVSSSGDLNIKGSAEYAEVNASSSADFEGERLKVKDAVLKASSSADISIHVSESIKARASSSADIEYSGNPKHKDLSTSGQADIDGY